MNNNDNETPSLNSSLDSSADLDPIQKNAEPTQDLDSADLASTTSQAPAPHSDLADEDSADNIAMHKEKGGDEPVATHSKIRRLWQFTLMVLVFLALGYVFYKHLHHQNEITLLENSLNNLTEQQDGRMQMFEQLQTQNAMLEQQISATQNRVADFQTDLIQQLAEQEQNNQQLQQEIVQLASQTLSKQQFNPYRWQMAEALYLIRIAQQRIVLQKDVEGALAILESADQRLRDIQDSGLILIRKQLNADRLALKQVRLIDQVGVITQIDALTDLIAKLQLVIPDVINAADNINPELKNAPSDEQTGFWQEVKQLVSIKNFLAKVK